MAVKALAYVNQTEIERSTDSVITRLVEFGSLPKDDWMLIKPMIYCVTGNMMAAVTMSRYGGENARLWIREFAGGMVKL